MTFMYKPYPVHSEHVDDSELDRISKLKERYHLVQGFIRSDNKVTQGKFIYDKLLKCFFKEQFKKNEARKEFLQLAGTLRYLETRCKQLNMEDDLYGGEIDGYVSN